jgi:type VII secretion protein EccB
VATRKDQLDAFNFARRRMVANLVVPSATGSDEGAPRPVKTFATSIVLSAVAVAAVAVLGVFKPTAPSGWQNGLALNSSTGAAYIDQNNELHAVYNITSAKLILGGNFAKYNVPASTLDNSGIPIGPEVGILGAPEDVPDASNMTLGQWSLCQNEVSATDETQPGGKTYLEIGYGPSASTVQGPWPSTADVGFIVHDSAQNVYLIEHGYRYELGNDQSDQQAVQQFVNAVYLDHSIVNNNVTGFWVADSWLDAFPQGAPVDYPELDHLGSVPGGAHQLGVVGQYGQLQNGSGYVVQTANGVVELSQFVYDLYSANPQLHDSGIQPLPASQLNQSAVDAAMAGNVGSLNAANVFENNTNGTSTFGSNWPPLAPAPLYGTDTSEAYEQNICVGYDYTGPSSVSKLTIWLSAQLPYGTATSQFGTRQSTSADYANVVLVKPGSGLIAQGSNGAAASGSQYLIEDSGYRYALLSSTVPAPSGSSSSPTTEKAGDMLGYKGVAVVPVPNSLLDLIQAGPNLSPAGASLSQGDG